MPITELTEGPAGEAVGGGARAGAGGARAPGRRARSARASMRTLTGTELKTRRAARSAPAAACSSARRNGCTCRRAPFIASSASRAPSPISPASTRSRPSISARRCNTDSWRNRLERSTTYREGVTDKTVSGRPPSSSTRPRFSNVRPDPASRSTTVRDAETPWSPAAAAIAAGGDHQGRVGSNSRRTRRCARRPARRCATAARSRPPTARTARRGLDRRMSRRSDPRPTASSRPRKNWHS